MTSRITAAVFGSMLLIGAPALTQAASAQAAQGNSTLVPVVVGAAAGATIGALLWPVFMAAMPAAAEWGWGAFWTTRALVGAAIGGGLGYISAR